MGHKYTREQILAGAVELALAEGVGSLTFGRLAKRLGTSDRVIVYYFPSKTTLVSDVLVEIGNQLQAVLAKAFTEPAAGHRQLAKAAYGVLARDETDAIFAVYFEACGLAAAGAQPFGDLAAALVDGWVGWLSGFFRGTPKQRRAEAEATLVLIDGVLLMRQLGGAQAADRAAKALGLM
jgi:AcrR family transcriptional regulator